MFACFSPLSSGVLWRNPKSIKKYPTDSASSCLWGILSAECWPISAKKLSHRYDGFETAREEGHYRKPFPAPEMLRNREPSIRKWRIWKRNKRSKQTNYTKYILVHGKGVFNLWHELWQFSFGVCHSVKESGRFLEQNKQKPRTGKKLYKCMAFPRKNVKSSV